MQHILTIIPRNKAISKEQKTFNGLLVKIDELKLLIANRELFDQKYAQFRFTHIGAMLDELRALKVAQLFALDRAYEQEGFPNRIQRRLEERLVSLTGHMLELFSFDAVDDQEILTIMAKHIEHLEEEDDKGELELYEGLQDADEENGYEEYKEYDRSRFGRSEEKAKTLGKGSSVRDIYIRLMKQLHPDKENDAELKEQKTVVVQEITAAYEEKDMLKLLKLQAEHGESAAKEMATLEDQELKQYNKVLKGQVAELMQRYEALLERSAISHLNSEKAIEQFVYIERSDLKKYLKQEKLLLKRVFEDSAVLLWWLKQG